MSDPLSVLSKIMLIYNTSKATKQMISKQPNVLLETTNTALVRIKDVSGQIDDLIVREVVSGFNLLSDALNVRDERLKREQLMLARNRFANLVALGKTGCNRGIENQYFRVAGFFGNFHYFSLNDDRGMATQQPILCT